MDTAGTSSTDHVLHLHILGSGSKGNCAIVEGPDGLIMVDDGFSRREVLARMHELGLDEADVRALILTHEHTDHVSGVSVWCRRFDGELYASAGTPDQRRYLACLPFSQFVPGEALDIAGVRVDTFPTSHDVVNPIGLRFSRARDSIGYATDTGVLTAEALRLLRGVRILALESNHDVPTLRAGSYPPVLQNRIVSERGHLSNEQAAAALPRLVTDQTEQLVAMHLSQENNRPDLAVRALAEALGATLADAGGLVATLGRGGRARALLIRAASQRQPLSCP